MARILILTQPYPPDPSTTGQHIADAAAALARRGHQVRVLAARRSYEDGSRRYPRREARHGVDVRRLALSSFGKRAPPLRALAALSFVFQAAIRGLVSRRPGVLVLSTVPPMCALAGLLLSWLRGVPVCFWIHDVHPELAVGMGVLRADSMFSRMTDWCNRRLIARARRVVVLDRHMAARIERKGGLPNRTATLPPWPHNSSDRDISAAANPWRRRHVRPNRRVVMFSGNHTLAHPLDTLLAAVVRCRDEDGLDFLFVGGGAGRPRVEAVAARDDVANVHCLPFQPLELLDYSLAAADVHVVSVGNHTVGLSHPCKIYGAMAAGRPVLLFGPPECHATDIIGKHDVGWHVAHGDVDAALDALAEIRDAPAQRLLDMGRAAQELVRRHYAKEALCEQFCRQVEQSMHPTLSVSASEGGAAP